MYCPDFAIYGYRESRPQPAATQDSAAPAAQEA
jgi:hypothetical protein